MPVAKIDLAQVIDVNKHERKRIAQPYSPLERVSEMLFEYMSVRQTSQDVCAHELLQSGLVVGNLMAERVKLSIFLTDEALQLQTVPLELSYLSLNLPVPRLSVELLEHLRKVGLHPATSI